MSLRRPEAPFHNGLPTSPGAGANSAFSATISSNCFPPASTDKAARLAASTTRFSNTVNKSLESVGQVSQLFELSDLAAFAIAQQPHRVMITNAWKTIFNFKSP